MQQSYDPYLSQNNPKQQSSRTSVTTAHSDVTFSNHSAWANLDDMAVKTLREAITYHRTVARAENKSEKTIVWTSRTTERFADFLGGDPLLSEINANDLRRFIIALRQTKKYASHPWRTPQEQSLASTSINCYVRAIRALFGFLYREGIIPVNPMLQVKPPKATRKVISTFTEADLKKLLAQPHKDTPTGYRDYTILLFLLDSCCRLSELVGLKLDDLDLENRTLRVTGKGDKQRLIPIGSRVAGLLARYIAKYRPKAGAANLFLTRLGKPLTPNKVEKNVRAYGQQAGIKGVRLSPHTLRHTGSVLFVKNGGGAFALQRILGHTSLEMTRVYCNLADADVRQAHRTASPGDRLEL